MVANGKKKNRRRTLTYAQKIWCWENNPRTCSICGKRVSKFSDAEFDHSKAFSKGGKTNLANVKIAHRQCNRLKGKKSLAEIRRILGIKPKAKQTVIRRSSKKQLEDHTRLVKEASEKLDPRFSHVEAWLFYPASVSYAKKQRDPKKNLTRFKIVVVTDLKRAYRVGNYVMSLILLDKIRWHSDDEQDIKEWCEKRGYTFIDKDATEQDLSAPYFYARIRDKKEIYKMGEAVLFETTYRGGLLNGFFDNEIVFPNGRNAWSWAPDTLYDNAPRMPGLLNGIVNKNSRWSWIIPSDAPSGKYRVFMRVYNHFGTKKREIAEQVEDTFSVA